MASALACGGLDGTQQSVDLAPIAANPEVGRIGFCNTVDGATLNVTIANRGTAATAAAVVVVFEPPSIRPGRLAVLGAGTEAAVQVSLPGDCFNPDCDFDIFVDPFDEIEETDETNNHAGGRCLGSGRPR